MTITCIFCRKIIHECKEEPKKYISVVCPDCSYKGVNLREHHGDSGFNPRPEGF